MKFAALRKMILYRSILAGENQIHAKENDDLIFQPKLV